VKTFILLVLMVVVVWVLFRPVTQKEIDKYNNKDNRPNLDL
tara:strand:+ start:574 stop:696 length:123 start_codon:yes stop_codon:yes gene_type:complete